MGQNMGSSQIDNGQRNFYSPNRAYLGTNTASPAPLQPNITIKTQAAIHRKEQKPPEGGFGNDFGNKAVILPPTLVIPIDLAETRSKSRPS
jgi:hypothetical protein